MAFSGPGRLPDQRMRRWRRMKTLSRESHRLYSLPPSRKMEIIVNPPYINQRTYPNAIHSYLYINICVICIHIQKAWNETP